MVRAAGIAAGALFLAIGLAAQFGGANVFGTPSYGHTEALAPALKPASPSPSAKPSPPAAASPAVASPVALAVSAGGTIYTAVPSSGGGHKKKKGGG